MEEESIKKQYELAYILPGDLGDDNAEKAKEGFGSFVQDVGGVITNTPNLRKQALAYPIEKKRDGYFGFINFTLDPARVKELNIKFRLDETLLRFLIVTDEPPKAVPPSRVPRRPKQRVVPGREDMGSRDVSSEPKPKSKVHLEDLEKKLKEILES